MALAITSVPDFKDCGQEFRATVVIAGSDNYATGGQTMSWKKIQIKSSENPTFGIGYSTAGWLAIYDVANDKVSLWNGTTEYGNGVSLAGVTVRMSLHFPKK